MMKVRGLNPSFQRVIILDDAVENVVRYQVAWPCRHAEFGTGIAFSRVPTNGVADHATVKPVAHFVSHHSAGVALESPICNWFGGANGCHVFRRDAKPARR